MNCREGAQIPERERLAAILLQYQRIKNGNAQQSARELGVSRNVPARIYKNATEREQSNQKGAQADQAWLKVLIAR